MPGTITHGSYTIPFDEEIFGAFLDNEPDLVSNAMVQCGALVNDAYIADLIAGGGNVYTMPFYGALADDNDQNYDGQTDIQLSTMGATQQTGVVYGRAKGWFADDFVADFTAANPMAAIAARVAKYWQNKKQARFIGIANAVLGISAMSSHVKTLNTLGVTTISDTAQEIWGEHKGMASMAVMHSAIAQLYEDMERVEYLKYTDPNGVTRELPIYQVNGLLAIIDDGVPKGTTGATSAGVYTITCGGTFAKDDVITINTSIECELDTSDVTDATAVATALKSALEADETFNATYSMTRSQGVITCTEKSGHYGAGKPTASVTSSAGTCVTAQTTAPGNAKTTYHTYLFGAGAFRQAQAPVAHPTFFGRDELKRGGMAYFGNRFRETIHPNGFNYTLPTTGSPAKPVVSPTDAQLADSTKWGLAYSDQKMIPFAKIISPAETASA